MKCILCYVLAGMLGLALAAAQSRADDWKPLFNGKDLTGWTPVGGAKGSWNVEDGMLYTTGSGGGGWLSTDGEYANFELRLEFRVPPGGNSGVFLRSPRQGDPAYSGMEIQVLDDAAKEYENIKPWQHCGSVYGIAAPSAQVTKKAGEWQKYHIVCDGRKVKIKLNDTQIVDVNLDDHKAEEKSHPGITRERGYIGLQNHGSRLDYKNIEIKTLP